MRAKRLTACAQRRQAPTTQLWLRAAPRIDDEVLLEGEGIIEITKNITSCTNTEAEMEELSSEAKYALEAFVKAARQHVGDTDHKRT